MAHTTIILDNLCFDMFVSHVSVWVPQHITWVVIMLSAHCSPPLLPIKIEYKNCKERKLMPTNPPDWTCDKQNKTKNGKKRKRKKESGMVRGQVEKVVCKGETQRSGTHEAKWVAAWQKPLGGGGIMICQWGSLLAWTWAYMYGHTSLWTWVV